MGVCSAVCKIILHEIIIVDHLLTIMTEMKIKMLEMEEMKVRMASLEDTVETLVLRAEQRDDDATMAVTHGRASYTCKNNIL